MNRLTAFWRAWYRSRGKRWFDLLVVSLSSPLWLVLTFIISLAVLLTLGSPLFFRQRRPGLGNQPFTLLKFRTMTEERDEQGRFLPDEARLTRFGKLLRSWSLDELPTLFNVLRGEMSLVGPRPLLMQYLPLYSKEQARRHEVKPGITGWAQVNGRNALTWEEKFKLDVWYVDNYSFWLDTKVLCLSFGKVIRRQGIAARGHVTMPLFTGERDSG